VSEKYRLLGTLKPRLPPSDLLSDRAELEGRAYQMRRVIAAVAALVALVLGGGAGLSAW
jgi:hypothetical protein